MSYLHSLKKLLGNFGINGYLIPKNDEFFSEYASPDRLNIVSNFSGSAGLAIILKEKNYLFVDGRYTIQALREAGKFFEVCEVPKNNIREITKKFNIKWQIGYDPKLFTKKFLSKNFSRDLNLIPINNNLVDLVTKKNSKLRNLKKFYILNKNIVGQSHEKKIQILSEILKKNKIDNIFISAPENVAWLLNMRGHDNPFSPIPNCKIIMSKNKKIYFFADKYKFENIKRKKIFKNIEFFDDIKFYSVLSNMYGKNCSIDENSCSIFYENLIKSKFEIIKREDPCYHLKSIKNKIEIKNSVKAHNEDGVALTKFLFQIKNTKKRLDEILLEKMLERHRRRNKNYLYPSFNTISGAGSNGAVIHYRATKKTNKKIRKSEIYLCDSGGQYNYGTTDVTRTICFNKPKKTIKDIFTRVLKGHIAVVTSKINNKTTGKTLDKKARHWLNKINLDYPHGTGHGVGFFLNVHEGPQSISKFNNIKIKEGMIMSNEPGYYKKNKFGIRIENLIYVLNKNNKLQFANLTMVPIDLDLVNFKMLNNFEKKYLKKYHEIIYKTISYRLSNKERKWLKSLL